MLLQGKRILVTGGAGSLGMLLVQRFLSGDVGVPAKVIVFSRDEAKHHSMRVALTNRRRRADDLFGQHVNNILEFRIGDVRSYSDVVSAVRDVDIVVNAAGLKQVPACEYFPSQALATNCLGPENIVRAIREHQLPVETVVGISTDKACKPVSAMGMTKAIQERIFTAANVLIPGTRFVCVRYGNVLVSSGSVVPLFQDQIRCGRSVTVTCPEMTRFFLTVDKPVDTIVAALRAAGRGEIFVPIVRSATIGNLAKALIGDRDVQVEVVGLRPGEKMHEILISDEECHHVVSHGDFYSILPTLPELRDGTLTTSARETEYSSSRELLGFTGTVALLRDHNLLMESVR